MFRYSYEDQNLVDEQYPPSISLCGKKCVTCNRDYLKTDPVYINKVTGKQFTVTDRMDGKTTGVAYLITCTEPNCPLQYTGQYTVESTVYWAVC